MAAAHVDVNNSRLYKYCVLNTRLRKKGRMKCCCFHGAEFPVKLHQVSVSGDTLSLSGV